MRFWSRSVSNGMKAHILALVWGIFFATPLVVGAQLSLPQTAEISISPRYPEAGETVRAELSAYTYDTTGASVIWSVDGVEVTEARDQRAINVTVGELGSTTAIEVMVTLRNGQVIVARQEVLVGQVDIIIDADTLVPEFYKGRPLPSNGSNVQVVAIPNFGDGKNVGDYSYSWRVNNKTLYGGSTKGRYIARFTVPMGKNIVVGVDVSDSTGVVISSKNVAIPIQKPEVIFYPDNPLRGLSFTSTGALYRLLGEEVTVRAEPYYMDADILDKEVLLEWSIDGSRIDNPNLDQQTIVLQNGGGSGIFNIEFHIRNLQELLQGTRGQFRMQF